MVLESNGNVVVSGPGSLNLTGLPVATTGDCGSGYTTPNSGSGLMAGVGGGDLVTNSN